MNTKTTVVAAALALMTTTSVFTQTSMSRPHLSIMANMPGAMKTSSGKMVAYCAECKMYYTPSDAKKMHMKDSMGHKLSMVPMSKVPKSAKMASMSTGSKM